MKVVTTFADARAESQSRGKSRSRVGLVPTMGYLHEGHLSLVERAASDSDCTIVSVFVNPLQFGDPNDLTTYPRDLERDVDLAADAGADIVFAPSVEEMYPPGSSTVVDVPGVSDAMEGVHRPGHFRGVATVVGKLFAGLRPDHAYFGRKDAQQLAVIETMARDLAFPVAVIGGPIVREHDGLALSSRNVRLTDDQRPAALTLSSGLFAAADRYEAGERSTAALIAAVAEHTTVPGVSLEYATVADATSAEPMQAFDGLQFLAVAARVGDVRLIDNITIDNDRATIDRGTRLDHPSILYGGP